MREGFKNIHPGTQNTFKDFNKTHTVDIVFRVFDAN